MGSFGNICRLCCGEESDLISIFNHSGYHDDYAGKIKKYLLIEVKESDILPQLLCEECVSHLYKCEEFVNRSQQAQEILSELHLETVIAMRKSKNSSQGDEASLVQCLLLQEQLYRNSNSAEEHFVKTDDDSRLLEQQKDMSSEASINGEESVADDAMDGNYIKSAPGECNDDDSTTDKNNSLIDRFDGNKHHKLNDEVSGKEETNISGNKNSENFEEQDSATNFENAIRNSDPQHIDSKGNNCNTERYQSNAESSSKSVSVNDSTDEALNNIEESTADGEDSNSSDDDNDAQFLGDKSNSSGPSDKDEAALLHDSRIREPIVKLELLTADQYDRPETTSSNAADGNASSCPLTHIARCSICEQPFLALSSLLLHHRMAHGHDPQPDKTLLCVFCPETFTDLNKLIEHVGEEHAGQSISDDEVIPPVRRGFTKRKVKNQCKECKKILPTLRGLRIHMKAHSRKRNKLKRCHIREYLRTLTDDEEDDQTVAAAAEESNKPKGNNKCEKCLKVLPSLRGLKIHMRKKHGLPKMARVTGLPKTKPRLYVRQSVRCFLCKDTLKDVSLLRAHLSAEHSDAECSTPFGCTICDKAYSNPSALSHHKAKHTMKLDKCKICHKSFDPRYIPRHMISHTEERSLECDVCGKTFKSEDYLKVHKAIHLPDEERYKWSCNLCDAKFTVKFALRGHIKVVHQKLKDFECRHCGHAFASKSAADIHERIHTGEKPFSCELCDYKGTCKRDVKSHRRVHTDYKPFECNTCGRRVRSSYQLKVHELTHTDIKPHPCQYCEKRFRTSKDMKTHERLHTGEKPYSCSFCSRAYSDYGNFHKHMKQVHPLEHDQAQREKPFHFNRNLSNSTTSSSNNNSSGKDTAYSAPEVPYTPNDDPATSSSNNNSSRMMAAPRVNNKIPRNVKSMPKSSSYVSRNQKSSTDSGNTSQHLDNHSMEQSSQSPIAPPLHPALGYHSALDTTSLSNLMSELRDTHSDMAAVNTFQAASALQLLRPSSSVQQPPHHLHQMSQPQQQYAHHQQLQAHFQQQQQQLHSQLQRQQTTSTSAVSAAAAASLSQQMHHHQQQQQSTSSKSFPPPGRASIFSTITSSSGGDNSNTSTDASMYPQQPAHMQHSHMQHIEQPYTPPFPASLHLQNQPIDGYDPTAMHLQRL